MDRLDKQRDRKERCGKATSRANVKTAAKLARRYGVTSSTYQLNLESRKSKNTFRREEKSAGLFSQLKATYDLSTALHSYMFYSGSKQHISSCCITQVARGQEMAPLLDLTPLGCSMSRCLESQFLKPLFYLSLILLKAWSERKYRFLPEWQTEPLEQDIPGQVQSNVLSITVLKLKGLLSPVHSLLPAWTQLLFQEGLACRAHPANAHGNQRELYSFVPCLIFANNPFHAFHRGYISRWYKNWGLVHANLILFGRQWLSGWYQLKGLWELTPAILL